MATRAYILIETSVGKTLEVCSRLTELDGVEIVDPVTGPYDIIAIINTESLSSVGDIVTTHIHKIPGVVRTVTCLQLS